MIDQQTFSITLADLISKQAAIQPNHIAVVHYGRQITYAELNSHSNRLAQALLAQGIGRGDVVAILAENCPEYLEVEIAAAKVGILLASLNWRMSDEDLRHCVDLVNPKVVFASDRYSERARSFCSPKVKQINLGGDLTDLRRSSPDIQPTAYVDPEDGLLILYTSGTTGRPKGAVISQRALLWRLNLYLSEAGVTRDEAYVVWSPLFHMAGSDYALATLMLGGKLIVTDGFDLDEMVNAIQSERLGYLPVVTGMIDRRIDALKERQIKPRVIRIIGAMADLVPPDQLAEITRLLDAPFMNSFGMTEVGTGPASGNQIPIGEVPESLSKRESTFTLLRLVDESGNDVAVGEAGEAIVRGPSLFSGYWQDSEATAQAFRGGWYHIGDVFRRNADGSVDFVERVSFMIKSGGENIYPSEIERALLEDSRVTEACVVGRSDPKWGEVPIALVSVSESVVTAEELIDRCGEILGRFKRPKEVLFIDYEAFPRNEAGKIIRSAVKELLQNDIGTVKK